MAARTALASTERSSSRLIPALCSQVVTPLAARNRLRSTGGTAIGLQLISGGADRSERLFQRYRADLWEKAAVLGFLLVALPALLGVRLGSSGFGTLLSGGWIPLLNLLVALKVTLGSWAMVQRLVRHRGLL